MAAGTAQIARARVHDPVASAMGTVRAPPRAAPLIIAAVHRPVAAPTLVGSCSRTTFGTSPAASAMPTPARNTETGRTPGTVAASRIARAMVRSSSASATVCRRPIRWAIRGTTSANAPMQTTGIVVSAPMAALDHPVAAWMSAVTVGTLDSAMRRFSATSESDVRISHRGWGCVTSVTGRLCSRTLAG